MLLKILRLSLPVDELLFVRLLGVPGLDGGVLDLGHDAPGADDDILPPGGVGGDLGIDGCGGETVL